MGAMKTPGVYIVEKNAFPNSVVEVATAVPAFIGYTQIAKDGNKSLLNKPKRISSMAEFRSYFGEAPVPQFSIADKAATSKSAGITLNSKLCEIKRTDSYNLYYHMLFFYANGGGPCYIVSVDEGYSSDLDKTKLIGGITSLLKEQEPTMVVIPEAVNLANAQDCYDVQTEMLKHCGYVLRNRVAIFDIYQGYQELSEGSVNTFREKIGSEFLDFGAAYYPWMHTSIIQESELSYKNIKQDNLAYLKSLIDGELDKFLDERLAKEDFTPEEKVTLAQPATNDEKSTLVTAKTKDLQDEKDALTAKTDKTDADTTRIAEIEEALKAVTVSDNEILLAKQKKIRDTKKVTLKQPMVNYINLLGTSMDDITANDLHKVLMKQSRVYSEVMKEMLTIINLLPVSAAMAGIYTMVDNTKEVWKAPANVGLSYVISPSINISHADQEDLNVPLNGKAVNAIRSFVGEGVKIWGARTLDANSLDWRYINVRRTMIMLEESIKNAARAYVFDPNVANTWVTVKSMINNFLNGIWKRGGLAGAVPEDAFSVHVGLGETMTPEDILEGIMRITVLVAISRPAEFIEITFQQQMQKS